MARRVTSVFSVAVPIRNQHHLGGAAAKRQHHSPAADVNLSVNSGAEWSSLTLRQACSQENPGSAMCVQSFDDSRGLAIRITYRISLRSSSLREPRHPLLKVVSDIITIVAIRRHPLAC